MIICAMPSESRIRGGCKMQENNVDVIFDAISENESFARVVAAAFDKIRPDLRGNIRYKNSSIRGSYQQYCARL